MISKFNLVIYVCGSIAMILVGIAKAVQIVHKKMTAQKKEKELQ